MTPQTGQQIITMHILCNLSRSKWNQIMKLDQLIEYNLRYIFLEKSYTKCGGELTIIDKMFEINSSFYVKHCSTGKVQFLFFRRFLLVLPKFSFR